MLIFRLLLLYYFFDPERSTVEKSHATGCSEKENSNNQVQSSSTIQYWSSVPFREEYMVGGDFSQSDLVQSRMFLEEVQKHVR